MKFLRDLFNRQTCVHVSMADLAAIAGPVMGPAGVPATPSAVAHAWAEMTDWIRIGFDSERDKGTCYNALSMSLRSIGGAIAQAAAQSGDKATSVPLSRSDLAVLRATYWQIAAATWGLEMIAQYQKKKPGMTLTTDELGRTWAQPDYTGVIPLWNRPDENHRAAAMRLAECQKRLDRFFVNSPIRPAGNHKIDSYAGRVRHFE